MELSFFPGGIVKQVAVFFLVLTGIVSAYSLMDYETEETGLRAPASVPANYDAMKACEKQELLWEKTVSTAYKELPEYKKLGLPQLISMSQQEISKKGSFHSDFAPEKWVKYLHRRGSMAKVKIVPVSSKYTGVFEGSECALLRLSLTYKVTGGKPVAPGLALKILRDGNPSANISALVSLNGQKKDWNFFKYPMSNVVPAGDGIGQDLVHRLFKRVTHYPEELLVNDMASMNVRGEKAVKVVSPRQLFFVPASQIKYSSDAHEVREDFAAIPEGTKVYELRALPEKYAGLDYSDYTAEKAEEYVKESEHIADIITTSEFVSSAFSDDGIFFRHQLRP